MGRMTATGLSRRKAAQPPWQMMRTRGAAERRQNRRDHRHMAAPHCGSMAPTTPTGRSVMQTRRRQPPPAARRRAMSTRRRWYWAGQKSRVDAASSDRTAAAKALARPGRASPRKLSPRAARGEQGSPRGGGQAPATATLRRVKGEGRTNRRGHRGLGPSRPVAGRHRGRASTGGSAGPEGDGERPRKADGGAVGARGRWEGAWLMVGPGWLVIPHDVPLSGAGG